MGGSLSSDINDIDEGINGTSYENVDQSDYSYYSEEETDTQNQNTQDSHTQDLQDSVGVIIDGTELSSAKFQITLLRQLLANEIEKTTEMRQVIDNHEQTIYKNKKIIRDLETKIGSLSILIDDTCNNFSNISNDVTNNMNKVKIS